MRILLATALFALLGPLSRATAQVDGSCPNQRASQVPGTHQDILPYRRCALTVQLFGVTISIGTGRCPIGHTSVAAHEECLGVVSANHGCETSGSVPVEMSLCRCVPIVWQGGPATRCECQDIGTVGFVATGHTFTCN